MEKKLLGGCRTIVTAALIGTLALGLGGTAALAAGWQDGVGAGCPRSAGVAGRMWAPCIGAGEAQAEGTGRASSAGCAWGVSSTRAARIGMDGASCGLAAGDAQYASGTGTGSTWGSADASSTPAGRTCVGDEQATGPQCVWGASDGQATGRRCAAVHVGECMPSAWRAARSAATRCDGAVGAWQADLPHSDVDGDGMRDAWQARGDSEGQAAARGNGAYVNRQDNGASARIRFAGKWSAMMRHGRCAR